MPVIKIHYFSDDLPRLKKTSKGDWIDLYCAQTMTPVSYTHLTLPTNSLV